MNYQKLFRTVFTRFVNKAEQEDEAAITFLRDYIARELSELKESTTKVSFFPQEVVIAAPVVSMKNANVVETALANIFEVRILRFKRTDREINSLDIVMVPFPEAW